MAHISYKSELYRKLIHLSSLWIVVVIWLLDKEQSQLIFSIVLGLLFLYEWVRRKPSSIATCLHTFSGAILREHENGAEKSSLTGATYMMVAVVICLLLFSKIVTITALSILITSDSAAALIGRKYGKHHFYGKTVEGSFAFFIAGIITLGVVGVIGDMSAPFFISGVVAVIGGLIAEAFSKKIYCDDNLTIPMVTAIILQGMMYLLD